MTASHVPLHGFHNPLLEAVWPELDPVPIAQAIRHMAIAERAPYPGPDSGANFRAGRATQAVEYLRLLQAVGVRSITRQEMRDHLLGRDVQIVASVAGDAPLDEAAALQALWRWQGLQHQVQVRPQGADTAKLLCRDKNPDWLSCLNGLDLAAMGWHGVIELRVPVQLRSLDDIARSHGFPGWHAGLPPEAAKTIGEDMDRQRYTPAAAFSMAAGEDGHCLARGHYQVRIGDGGERVLLIDAIDTPWSELALQAERLGCPWEQFTVLDGQEPLGGKMDRDVALSALRAAESLKSEHALSIQGERRPGVWPHPLAARNVTGLPLDHGHEASTRLMLTTLLRHADELGVTHVVRPRSASMHECALRHASKPDADVLARQGAALANVLAGHPLADCGQPVMVQGQVHAGVLMGEELRALARTSQPLYCKRGGMPAGEMFSSAQELMLALDEEFGDAFWTLWHRGVFALYDRDVGLPDELRGGRHGTVAAVWQGQIHLVADQIGRDELRAVVLHELGVHVGMPAMLPEAEYQMCLASMRHAYMRGAPWACAAYEQAKRAGEVEHRDEEALAYAVMEHAAPPTMMARVRAGVKLFLGRLGVPATWAPLNAKELAAVAHGCLQRVTAGLARNPQRPWPLFRASPAFAKERAGRKVFVAANIPADHGFQTPHFGLPDGYDAEEAPWGHGLYCYADESWAERHRALLATNRPAVLRDGCYVDRASAEGRVLYPLLRRDGSLEVQEAVRLGLANRKSVLATLRPYVTGSLSVSDEAHATMRREYESVSREIELLSDLQKADLALSAGQLITLAAPDLRNVVLVDWGASLQKQPAGVREAFHALGIPRDFDGWLETRPGRFSTGGGQYVEPFIARRKNEGTGEIEQQVIGWRAVDVHGKTVAVRVSLDKAKAEIEEQPSMPIGGAAGALNVLRELLGSARAVAEKLLEYGVAGVSYRGRARGLDYVLFAPPTFERARADLVRGECGAACER